MQGRNNARGRVRLEGSGLEDSGLEGSGREGRLEGSGRRLGRHGGRQIRECEASRKKGRAKRESSSDEMDGATQTTNPNRSTKKPNNNLKNSMTFTPPSRADGLADPLPTHQRDTEHRCSAGRAGRWGR